MTKIFINPSNFIQLDAVRALLDANRAPHWVDRKDAIVCAIVSEEKADFCVNEISALLGKLGEEYPRWNVWQEKI